MAKYLYGASVQGIQEYIFATNELKSIIGASEIIKRINEDIKKRYPDNIIINAAGNIKLLFEETQKQELEDLVCNFVKEQKQKAFGITISQAVVTFEVGELKDAFDTLEKKLATQRNKTEPPLDMSINILKLAAKSAKPLVESEYDMATAQKISMAIDKNLTGHIPKNKKNKTAIIHADGNGLGAMIASMIEGKTSDEEIKKTYQEFSEKLENATTSAFKKAKDSFGEYDIRDVILGGDDMTVICNANVAFEFTNAFLKEFELQSGLTACAGIAYCNYKYPFHYAINLAESLCSFAKSHSRTDSSLIFHNIQSSNFESFEEYREKELLLENKSGQIHLDYGPYFTKPKQDYSSADSFLYICEAFKIKGSPINRLREWLTLLGQDATAAKERLKRINQVMDLKDSLYKKKALENCMRHFHPEIQLDDLTIVRQNKKYTPIGDINSYLSVIDFENKETSVECK